MDFFRNRIVNVFVVSYSFAHLLSWGVDGGFGFIAVDLIKGKKVKGDTIRGMLTSADSMACA